MTADHVLGFCLGMLFAIAAVIIGVTTAPPCGETPPPIERNQWGQEALTERELCEATILRWDEERCP